MKKRSTLHDYMRNAYEEFAELLIQELIKKYPKARTSKAVLEAVQKLLDEHFGKDRGGDVDV